jgi:hypothetical protein
MSRRTRGIGVAVILVVIAFFTYLRIHGMLQRGEPVVWLAELWAPAAVLSIGLVSCLEFLLPQAPAAVAAPPKRKKARK